MITKPQTSFSKDRTGNKLVVEREFEAPVQQVWKAWTESHLLDQWWAPRPWKAETKSMDFREGGFWLYSMNGPDGTRTWCRVNYETIDPGKSFTGIDFFCDEAGKENEEFPRMHWRTDFLPTPSGTRVVVEITFASPADLEKIMEMGFQEGFTAALGNLDELLEK